MLAHHWGIPLQKKAKRTLQYTTQHGVRNIANLTLVRRFCTHDCMLQYCCLHHTIFTDTMFASILSRRGNKCAQIFSSDFSWFCAYPMKTKGELHSALSFVFQQEGVPPLMVMDCLKEQTLASSARIFVMLAVRNSPQNLTLLGRMLLSVRSMNSRKAPVGSCSSSTCTGDFGTIVWNMRPI